MKSPLVILSQFVKILFLRRVMDYNRTPNLFFDVLEQY